MFADFFNTFDSYVTSLVLFIVGKRSQVLPTDGKELVKMLQGRYSKIRLAVFFGRFDSKGTPDVRALKETQEHSAQLTDWFVAYDAESRSWVRGRKHICGCAPPPYVHLASTWRHTRDEWDQAFPVFRALPLPCIIPNANRRTKNGGGLGTRLT